MVQYLFFMRTLVLLLMFGSCSNLLAYQPEYFYRQQCGVRIGISDNTAPKMKIGYHIGVSVRANHHTFEFHHENFGNIEIFQISSYITLNGLFYGWTWAQRNAQFQVIVGGGSADYVFNHDNRVERGAGLYAESSVSGLINIRGNGVGLKLAGNINPMESFVSAGLFLQFGWAWKPTQGTDQ